jgi:hypothetical protein
MLWTYRGSVSCVRASNLPFIRIIVESFPKPGLASSIGCRESPDLTARNCWLDESACLIQHGLGNREDPGMWRHLNAYGYAVCRSADKVFTRSAKRGFSALRRTEAKWY